MKRWISILLVLCMMPMLLVPAFAAKKCDCGHAPVIYVPGFGKSLFEDTEDGSERIYPPTTEKFKDNTKTIVFAVLALLGHHYRLFADLAMRASEDLLGKIACDKEGNPLSNTGVHAGALPSKDVHGSMRDGIADYTFVYDWRLNPPEIAEQLHEYVQRVLSLSGHTQAAFVCHSMGGTVLASYIAKYGSDDIERMVCLTPAWKGISIMGSLLSGEADIGDKGDELYMFLQSAPILQDEKIQKAVRIAGKIGLCKAIMRFLQKPLDHQFERVYYTCLRGMFAQMPGMWAFVPDCYYERAKAFTFGNDEEYATLIEKIDDYHYNVQNRLTELLQGAVDNGMQLVIASGYGISTLPLSRQHTAQSDFLIDTVYTSIGAITLPFGSKLPAAHTQPVKDGHNHISADLLIDASTCAFPEQTWFVRDLMHFDYPTSAAPFVRWALSQPKGLNVFSDPQYPQFLVWNEDTGFSPLTADE